MAILRALDTATRGSRDPVARARFTEVMESYAIRDSPGRAIRPAHTVFLTAIPPALIAFLIWLVRDDLRHWFWAILLLGFTGLAMAVLTVVLVVLGVLRIIRGARRTVLFAVDRDGILLGDPDRHIPWTQIRRLVFYTTSARHGSGEDPPLRYSSWLQADLTDGTADRRPEPDGRRPWGDLVEAISRLAPAVTVDQRGVLPEGDDPFVRPR
jgi:hypothetical protein